MSRFHGNYADVGKAADYVLDASGGDAIVVPDAHLLFTGAFKRVGPDLLIDGDGRRALLPDYFSHEHGATLLSPNGARLGPDTVRALAGEDSPWQVAQAGGAGGPPEVGTVRTLAGAASVQRGGVSQPLSTGAPIYLGDVVETDASSTLGIILRDNTVFSLSASARMVMNELVYDPARSDNAMAISLVQGTFVFITGQVAKTGSVAITTPVATMGIRGTTPIVRLSTIDGSGEFGIAPDPTPGNPVGNYTLTLPSGMQTNVASPDVIIRVTSAASFDAITKTFAEQQSDQQIVAPAYQVYSLIGQRGDIPSPNQQANATGKGQGSGGFQYAFAVMNFAELSATQLLDNTVIAQPETPGDLSTYEDVLRSVIVGSELRIDLDTTASGFNRHVEILENFELPVTIAPQIILPPNVTHLASATVVLQNQLPGESLSVLFGAVPPGITVTVTLGKNQVNLSGDASAADYIAAIQAIHFITNDDPSTQERAIVVTVTAVGGENATATTFVTIEPVNDAPVNHLPGEQTAAEDVTFVFSSSNVPTPNAITVSDVDAGAQSLTTTLSVQHGTLTIADGIIAATGVTVDGNSTGMLVVSGSQSAITAALDGLVYAANANFHGSDTLVVSTNDNGATGSGGLLTTSDGLAIDVASVNDAPDGTDKTIATREDTAVILTAADFGFSDPNDSPANSLAAVKITRLPGSGTLTLNGCAVAAGDFVPFADITADNLVWTPGANKHGHDLARLTFQVQDDGGTAYGGVDLDPTPNTLTFNVRPVNDAPDGTDKTIATREDTAVILTAADFGFSDPNDLPANSLAAVKITRLPGSGTLTLNGCAVAAGDFVPFADITADNLVWTPGANKHGHDLARLTFQVQDDGGTAYGGVDLDPTPNTLTFNVRPVNDAPDGRNNTIATREDTAVILTAADFGFSDPNDSPANSLAAVKITRLPGSGTLTLNGCAVAAGDFVPFADITADNLVWTPGANKHGHDLARLTFQVQDDGGTAYGGVDLDPTPNTLTFNVRPVNDAPDGRNNTIATREDTAVILTAADFGFSDPNDSPANSLAAVKITRLPGSGTLTLNGCAVAAGDFVPFADITADNLVWTPGANKHGHDLARLTFQVQDDGGTAYGGVDLDPTPNTLTFNVRPVNDAPDGRNNTVTTREDTAVILTAADFGFSDPNDSPANSLAAVKITRLPGSGTLTLNGCAVAAGDFVPFADITADNLVWTPGANKHGHDLARLTFQVQDDGGTAYGGVDLDPTPNTLTFNVRPVNDAPDGRNNTVTTREDTAVILTAADFGFSDPNDSPANSLAAVKITRLPGSGTLTLNGCAVAAGDFVPFADITADNLVWTPGANKHGHDLARLTFQVQDDGGTAYGGVDLDPTPNTLTFNVRPVNDAPDGRNNTVTTREDTAVILTAADFGFSDPNDSPANSLAAVKITRLPGSGTLTLNGCAVAAGDFVPFADITADNLVWTPGANKHGHDLARLTFQVQDDGGTAYGGVDLDPTPNTLTFNVRPVNDAPDGRNNTVTTREDTAVILTAADFGFSDPNDSPANSLEAVKITRLPGSGTLTLNGCAVAAGDFVPFADITADNLVWTPGANKHGHDLARLTFQVQDDGGTAYGGVDLDPTPNTLTFNVDGGAGGALIDRDTIRIELESDDHSFSFRSANSLLSFGATSDTYTGVGSAVDVIDFSTAAFANTTTVAFGAKAPIDQTYAIDILSHFDGGSHQIDLSGLFDKSAGAGVVNADNINDYVQFDDQGGGKVNPLVDADGAGGTSAPIKIGEISGTAGPDHHQHALGSSASDVIAVVFDQAQPAAPVGISHAG